MTPDAALARLRQYGERTSTWSTATYNDGTEKALQGIALVLATEVEQLRARVAELEAEQEKLIRWHREDGEALTEVRAKFAETAATVAQLVLERGERVKVENALRDQVTELEAQRDRRRARLVALQNDALDMRGSLSPNGEARKVPFPLGETLTPAVDWLINRVSELEGDLNAGVNDAIRNAMEGSAVRRARSEALAEAADKLVLELTPETQAAGHGFLHTLRLATRSLRRMADEAATQ
ncbi:hypothetical protein OHA04_45345 (plasmid) [Streptomyces sp. NBC_01590]|uniref:hypothetical protein n=1 Tax=Streptomyces sp. NBC_01590 TaxID=2975887 RepID=UPI002F9175F5